MKQRPPRFTHTSSLLGMERMWIVLESMFAEEKKTRMGNYWREGKGMNDDEQEMGTMSMTERGEAHVLIEKESRESSGVQDRVAHVGSIKSLPF